MQGPLVIIEQHWTEFSAELELRLTEAVRAGAEAVKAAVETRETREGDASPTRAISPGVHLRDSFRIAPPIREPHGITVLVYTPDRNAIYQELGTRGRRRRKLKRAATSTYENQSGVKPLHFMARGARDAYPIFHAAVEEALR